MRIHVPLGRSQNTCSLFAWISHTSSTFQADQELDVKPKAILRDFQLCWQLANPAARAGGTGGPRMAANIATTLGQDHRQGMGRWAWDLCSAAEVLQRLDHTHTSQKTSNGFARLKSRPFYEQFFLFVHTFSAGGTAQSWCRGQLIIPCHSGLRGGGGISSQQGSFLWVLGKGPPEAGKWHLKAKG